MRELVLDERTRLVELVDRRNHREHDAQPAAGGGAQQRADLAAQEARAVQAEPDRPPAERGVLLLHDTHIGKNLIPTNIERPEGYGLLACGIEHSLVKLQLLRGARESGRNHELKLRAEQADARSAGLLK